MSSRWRNEGGFQDREPGGSHHPQPEGGRRVLPEPRGGPEEARLVHVTRGARNRIETCWTAGARGHNGGRKRSLERPPPNPSEGSPLPRSSYSRPGWPRRFKDGAQQGGHGSKDQRPKTHGPGNGPQFSSRHFMAACRSGRC